MDSLFPQETSRLPYLHTPLEKADSQIRLLKILTTVTDSRDTPISIDLQTFDIETAPTYIALSYEWGTEDDLASVAIDDRVLSIRRNLYDFFTTYMSCQDLDVHFWIDQISIDQHNVDERNQQVTIMASIFSEAKEVISWLGGYAEPEDVTQDLSCLLNDTCISPDDDRLPVSNALRRGEIYHLLSSPQLSLLDCLAKKSYWKRLWIAQEIALAKMCWVMYGPQRIPVAALVRLGTVFLGWTEPFKVLLALVQEYAECKLSRESSAAHRSFVKSVMRFSAVSCCTDPRDKIYGIQSILPIRFRIAVDYRLSTRQTFTKIVTSYTVIFIADDSEPFDGLDAPTVIDLAVAMGLVDPVPTENHDYLMDWFEEQCFQCEKVRNALEEVPADRLEPLGLRRGEICRKLARGIAEEMLNEEQDLFDEFVDVFAILDNPPYSDKQLKECARLLSRFSREAQQDSRHVTGREPVGLST